jgi:hypothetical protein
MADNKSVTDPVAEIAERALRKTSVIRVDGWDGASQRFIFVAPYDCRVDQVSIVSSTGVPANDTNYYGFQVQNLTASAALLASAKTTQATGGEAVTADVPYELSPDQNQVVSDGDVLELQVTENGTGTDLTAAQVIVAVEYT